MCKKNKDNKIKKIEAGVSDMSLLDIELLNLLALGYLEGSIKKIHTEEVAVLLWKWSPKDFGFKLEKYNKIHPDKEKARKGLMKLRNFEWVIGSTNVNIIKDGWRLTSEGNKYYQKIKHMHGQKKINTEFSKKELSIIKRRIGGSSLYKKYLYAKEGNKKFKTDEYSLEDLFQTPFELKKEMRKKFFEYYIISEHSNMIDYMKFLKHIQNQYEDVFDKKKWINEARTQKKK